MGLKNKIIETMVERKFLKVVFSKIRMSMDIVLSIPARKWLAKHSKVQNNKVMFMTYNNDYICNPKYICEEILRQELPLELIWASTNKKIFETDQYPGNLKLVRRDSYEFFKEMATSKVWVDNALCFPWNLFPKKKEQFYLQTWHGSMGLKKIGSEDVKDKAWVKKSKRANAWTDICISNSKFETQVFRDTHWKDVGIKELGHARNDILFADAERKRNIRRKVFSYYGIEKNKKAALYAPTFRDAGGQNYYSMEYTRLLNILEEVFNGEWVLLNRFHFKTKEMRQKRFKESRVIQATDYPDMQELMVAVDLGITDYSSWICDFVLTGKPGFIFAPDLEDYDQERGFYYPLSSTPFLIAQNNREMEENIREFDREKYEEKRKRFLEERGCIEDGHAAEKIVELIKKQCECL